MAGKSSNRQPHRRDRLIREREHDPYKAQQKRIDPTVCPQCNAVYQQGHWGWVSPPTGAHQETCQACHRINDNYPAGEVRVSGTFLADHKPEIMNLIENQQQAEKSRNPMRRIMAIEEAEDGIVITTTDIHLPRRIVEALHHAYKGDMDFSYDEEGHFIRASWSRDS